MGAMPPPRRLGRPVAAAVALVLLAGLLGACGDDSPTVQAGDVIRARHDDQFEDGQKSVVAVPVGRLVIRSEEPVDSIAREDTRELDAIDAPAGMTFVPMTWQYNSEAFDDLAEYVETNADPVVDLVADGQSYRLPSPDDQREDGESFYVLVDGSGDDLTLRVEFDGVGQEVDLVTGERERDQATGLYRIDDSRLRSRSCDSNKWFDTEGFAEFTCDIKGPVVLPYAAGRWAEPGHAMVALTITTSLRRYTVQDSPGVGAQYGGVNVAATLRLDGEKPVDKILTRDSECPSPETFACVYSAHVIFEVQMDDDEVPADRLEVKDKFKLKVGPRWGGYDAPSQTKIVAEHTIRLDEDDEKGKGKGDDEDDDA